jgi:hypothetical protein
MNARKIKITLLIILAVFLVGISTVYFKYQKVSKLVADTINTRLNKKVKRKINFGKIGFSILEGIIIHDAAASHSYGTSKENFFTARKVILTPELIPLLKNKIFFKKVEFINSEFKIKREINGKWNFEDLLLLLPETTKGLYLTWNTKELIFVDSNAEIEDKVSQTVFSLENSDLGIYHYSSFGGNFKFSLEGDFKTAFSNNLLQGEMEIESNANFEYSGLSSSFGKIILGDVIFNEITLEKSELEWKLFGMRKKIPERNCFAAFKVNNIFIPSHNPVVKQYIIKPLENFSSVLGKKLPEIEDVQIEKLSVNASLKDKTLNISEFNLDTNFLDLKYNFQIDTDKKTINLKLLTKLGTDKFEIMANGAVYNPEIKPELSYTARTRFVSLLKSLSDKLNKFLYGEGKNE